MQANLGSFRRESSYLHEVVTRYMLSIDRAGYLEEPAWRESLPREEDEPITPAARRAQDLPDREGGQGRGWQ